MQQNNLTAPVVLFEGISSKAYDHFKQADMDFCTSPSSASEQDLSLIQKTAKIIGIRSRTHLDEKFFAGAEQLEAVGCFCIGTNQVDLAAARKHGVAVFNAPHSNTRSVAELVLGEIIMLMRRIPITNREMHKGSWNKNASNRHEVRGKTLGIIGYGNIGSQLSILAEDLGMRVLFYDVTNKLAMGNAKSAGNIKKLLNESDAISLHVPETPKTRNMMNAEKLAMCKPGAIVINASRGTVVDIDALLKGLESGHIGGAALDVFPVEPGSNSGEFISPLIGKENVILTSHIGGSTVEAQESIGEEVSIKLVDYYRWGSSQGAVNFPQIALDAPEQVRLLHLHRNLPGVLSAINKIIASHEINISGSHLMTFNDLGYATIDIERSDGIEALCAELERLPEAIRVRAI